MHKCFGKQEWSFEWWFPYFSSLAVSFGIVCNCGFIISFLTLLAVLSNKHSCASSLVTAAMQELHLASHVLPVLIKSLYFVFQSWCPAHFPVLVGCSLLSRESLWEMLKTSKRGLIPQPLASQKSFALVLECWVAAQSHRSYLMCPSCWWYFDLDLQPPRKECKWWIFVEVWKMQVECLMRTCHVLTPRFYSKRVCISLLLTGLVLRSTRELLTPLDVSVILETESAAINLGAEPRPPELGGSVCRPFPASSVHQALRGLFRCCWHLENCGWFILE